MPAPSFEQPGWQAAPGLHAFIIGASAYQHLPPAPTGDPAHFGMVQLASPALTAFRLATFLKNSAHRLAVPLATCRVLLAPSAAELALEPALEGFAPPDFVNFSLEAKAWRADALADPLGITLFYFAGHGLQRVKRDHVLVLHNFNDGVGGSLASKGINVDHLFDGMAPSVGQESIARTQLYFFDTCRIHAEAFKEHEIMGVGSFWDVNKVPAIDDRTQPSFYSSGPGGTAFAKAGRETFFGGALLKCLEGGAGVPADEIDPEHSEWIVSLDSLRAALNKHIEMANRREGGNQDIPITQNLERDFTLLKLATPPDVVVTLKIDPDSAADVARVSVVDEEDQIVRDLVPFKPNPLEITLPGGVFRVRAVVNPEDPMLRPRRQIVFVIKPPSASCPLGLARQQVAGETRGHP